MGNVGESTQRMSDGRNYHLMKLSLKPDFMLLTAPAHSGRSAFVPQSSVSRMFADFILRVLYEYEVLRASNLLLRMPEVLCSVASA